MKNLEELLRNTPKPEVKVTFFQQDLRRSLLNSLRYSQADEINYRFAFYLSAAVISVLAAVLVLFVMQPEYPDQIHQVFTPQTMPLALENGHQINGANGNGAQSDDRLGDMYFQPAVSNELEQEFVRYLAERGYQLGASGITPVNQRALYSVNQYQLDNGKSVYVYTQIPDVPDKKTVSY